jgi:hypothetical protein
MCNTDSINRFGCGGIEHSYQTVVLHTPESLSLILSEIHVISCSKNKKLVTSGFLGAVYED